MGLASDYEKWMDSMRRIKRERETAAIRKVNTVSMLAAAMKAQKPRSEADDTMGYVHETPITVPASMIQRLRDRALDAEIWEGRCLKAELGQGQAEYLSQDRVAVARAHDLERMVDLLQSENLRLRRSPWYSRLFRRSGRTTP